MDARAYGSPGATTTMFGPLRRGLLELERREQLLDVLHLEQSALVLVVSPSRVGSPALGRLAVAEVQGVGFLRNIGDIGVAN